MMKLLLRCFVSFLLLQGVLCFGLEARFLQEHACVRSAGGFGCSVIPGDTLSEFALVFKHDGRLYNPIAEENGIKDANRIYPGMTIVIPNGPTKPGRRTMAYSHAYAAASFSFRPVHIDATLATKTLTLHDEIPAVTVAQATMPFADLVVPIVTTTTMTAATAAPTTATMTVSKTSNAVPAQAVPMKADQRPVAGYKLAIPIVAAEKMGGIPIGAALITHYYVYNATTGRACGYLRLRKASFARKEGDTIVLYVPLKEIPSQPFSLIINGIRDPIDGVTFTTHSQPVRGRIPGPHHTMRNLFTAISLGGSGYTLTAAFGPIAGPSVIGGVILTKAIMRHIAEAGVENAEQNYNRTLQQTQGITPSKEEGQ